MTLQAIIEGLQILAKYHRDKHGYHVGASHDLIYVYPTEAEVYKDDLHRLIELGWWQDNDNDEFGIEDYDVDECWKCFV